MQVPSLAFVDESLRLPSGSAAVGAGIAAAVGAAVLVGRAWKRESELNAIVQRVRESRDARMELDTEALEAVEARLRKSGGMPSDEDVLGASATELARKIASKELSSVGVVAFFARRCLEFQPTLNAVTETRFREALDEAEAVDAHIAAGGDPKGPLYGVPVSVKDQFHQQGMLTTMGSIAFAAKGPMPRDGSAVSLIRAAGAIPFVRSAVPQLLMAPETDSAVWGRSNNPYDTTRCPGGSSGGEGALVGSLCSPLGVGTDIGGSLRIPASHCGVATLKMTPQRVSLAGIGSPRGPPFADPVTGVPFSGNDGVRPVWGPVARHPDDVEAVCAAALAPAARAADPTAPPCPWDASAAAFPAGRPLRVGVLASGDGFFAPGAAARRTVEDAAAALRAAGHTVVPFDGRAARLHECALGYLEIMSADGGMRGMRSGLGGEPMHALYGELARAAAVPTWVRSLVVMPALRLMGMPRLASVVWAARAKSAHDLWLAAGMRDARRAAFCGALDEQGRAAGCGPLDALLCPAFPVPATPHGDSRDMSLAASSAFVFNYLHVPAGVLTVSRVLEGEDGRGALAEEDGSDKIGNAAARGLVGAAGLPVAVQLVARPFEDEAVLRAMRAVRAAAAAAREAGGPLGRRLTPPSVPTAPIDVPGCL